MSPYGKITVVKTLALSKLSHAALVIPTVTNNKIRDLEKIIFNFIWSGKQDKIKRDVLKLTEIDGGLGLTDIQDFWTSLKFSWFRKLNQTTAFWPKILETSVSQIIQRIY